MATLILIVVSFGLGYWLALPSVIRKSLVDELKDAKDANEGFKERIPEVRKAINEFDKIVKRTEMLEEYSVGVVKASYEVRDNKTGEVVSTLKFEFKDEEQQQKFELEQQDHPLLHVKRVDAV